MLIFVLLRLQENGEERHFMALTDTFFRLHCLNNRSIYTSSPYILLNIDLLPLCGIYQTGK